MNRLQEYWEPKLGTDYCFLHSRSETTNGPLSVGRQCGCDTQFLAVWLQWVDIECCLATKPANLFEKSCCGARKIVIEVLGGKESDTGINFEAALHPNLKAVFGKSQDQLDLPALHRVRSRLGSHRTAKVNQIRAYLIELGITVHVKPNKATT